MVWVLLIAGAAAVLLIAALGISIRHPARRLWPPKYADDWTAAIGWLLTVIVFSGAILLGVLDWNRFGWPAVFRWPVGLGLVLIGNLIVWKGVFKLGLKAAIGAKDQLVTDGLYRYSRNPQYVADIAILVGWLILSASLWAVPVIGLGLVTLIMAPFAEEPWLEETYGEAYRRYRVRTQRFLFFRAGRRL